jgi:hypothetical protein
VSNGFEPRANVGSVASHVASHLNGTQFIDEGESISRSQIEVIRFLRLSLGSRRACAFSQLGFGSQNGDSA